MMNNMEKVKELVDLMYWDYDRMSSSGQETLDKLADAVGLPKEGEEDE